MSGRAEHVRIRLPIALLERVRQEAAQCGVTVREFVTQAAHGALAERLCLHARRGSEPPPAVDPEEPEDP
jgi:hypothetical protein